jgi:hypothetical protein
MKPIRTLLLAALLVPALPVQAAEEPSDASLGHVLTLVHMFVRIAAESDSSQMSLRAIDEVLAGRTTRLPACSRMRWPTCRPRTAPPSPPSAATWSVWRARTSSG